MSESNQISAMRTGGIGFFRIILPALVFSWFVVLLTFLLSEKVAPSSTMRAKLYIQRQLIERGISQEESDISYMDEAAGWLFAAASGEGNVFYDVKWWDFSRPGEITLYTADEGVWQADRWEFHNASVINIGIAQDQNPSEAAEQGHEALSGLLRQGSVIRSMTSETLEMKIARTPTDILARERRDPEEMSLQELRAFLSSPEAEDFTPQYIRKIEGTYHLKIAVPFASVVFILLAAPLGLTPQRSSGSVGIGFSIFLVFIYYLLTTFSVKIAEGGLLPPAAAAWLPNVLFLAAGVLLNMKNGARHLFS
jgi:lipopolysaccharide export system permease protein